MNEKEYRIKHQNADIALETKIFQRFQIPEEILADLSPDVIKQVAKGLEVVSAAIDSREEKMAECDLAKAGRDDKKAEENYSKLRQALLQTLGLTDYNFRIDDTNKDSERYLSTISTVFDGVEVYEEIDEKGRSIALRYNPATRVLDKNMEKRNKKLIGQEANAVDMTKRMEEMRLRADFKEAAEDKILWRANREKVANSRYIFLDIDDCLLPSKSLLDKSLLMEIAKLSREVPIVFCTGRAIPDTKKVIEEVNKLGGQIQFAVGENGVALYDPENDETIINARIDDATKKILVDLKNLLTDKVVGAGKGKMEKGKEVCISLNPLEGQDILKFRKEVEELIAASGFKSENYTIKNSSTAVDITPRGIDKATGLEEFEKRFKVSRQEIVGIGDSGGDSPILDNVGSAASPYNATPDLKIMVDYISPYDTTAGVVDILRQIKKIKAGGKEK